MTRRSLRTALHVALGAAFVLAAAEKATGAGVCPHHDRLPAAGAEQGAAGHADHGGGTEDGHETHGPCACLGACQHSAAVGSAPPVWETRAVPEPVRGRRTAPAEARPRAPAPYTLPWSTAPPPIR